MGVDFLRTCYRRPARLVLNSGQTVPIRWYFCAPGAKLLPIPTAVGSLVWEYEERELIGPGEADRSFEWDRGTNRGYDGQSFQGLEDWYVNGVPADLLGVQPPPRVCTLAALQPFGGVELNATAPLFFSTGIAGTGGVCCGGSSYGHFLLTGQGGVCMNSSAGFEGPIDLMGSGGVEIGSTAYAFINGGGFP